MKKVLLPWGQISYLQLLWIIVYFYYFSPGNSPRFVNVYLGGVMIKHVLGAHA